MYKTISYKRHSFTDKISYFIIVSVPLVFAILNLCIHWCKTEECLKVLSHFKQDPPRFSIHTKNGLTVFIAVAFLIESLRNCVQKKPNNRVSSHTIDVDSDHLGIIYLSDQYSQPRRYTSLLNSSSEQLDDLRKINSIEILLRVIYDHDESLQNKVLITQSEFEQATQLIHTLWKLLNMISDFLSITGVPVHEKTYAEFSTIACCWLRISSFIKFRRLQIDTETNKQNNLNFDWPESTLINKAVFEVITQQPLEYNTNLDELSRLNKVLFCCLMFTNLSILLNGVMNTNSKEYQISQFSINSFIMLMPYMYFLKVEKNLTKIIQVKLVFKQKSWIQEYLPEIFSIVGTLQAVALISKQTDLAFACVVINTSLNTIVSILDIVKGLKSIKLSH